MVGEPRKLQDPNEEGIIRVKITVDKSGKVVDARYDPRNSTARNSDLIAQALASARTAKFSSHPTKPTRIGWIEFNFKLR